MAADNRGHFLLCYDDIMLDVKRVVVKVTLVSFMMATAMLAVVALGLLVWAPFWRHTGELGQLVQALAWAGGALGIGLLWQELTVSLIKRWGL